MSPSSSTTAPGRRCSVFCASQRSKSPRALSPRGGGCVATRLQAPVRAAVELRPVPSRTRNRRGAARRRAGGCSALASSSTVSARCLLLPRAARPGAEPRSRAGTRQPRGWGGRRRRRRLGAVGGSARRQRRSCSATSTTAASKPRAPPALGGARSRVLPRAAVKAMAQGVARGRSLGARPGSVLAR